MVQAQNIKTAYFGGGCFWCMEESFEKVEGVLEVTSGYSGGKTENPTYKEVTYGNSGHFEVIEIEYDDEKINYKELLDIYWINIDPFDKAGQFCDKGFSYRSVAFYSLDFQKTLIDKSIQKLEKQYGPFEENEANQFAKSLIQKNIDDFYHRAWVINNN